MILARTLNQYWCTNVLYDNINNLDYVYSLYNYFMQRYDMSEQWPTNVTDINIFTDKNHRSDIYDKLEKFIKDQIEYYCKASFNLSDNALSKLKTKCHISNHNTIRGHQHSGSVISGVFYVRCPNGGDLILHDPRSNAMRGYPGDFMTHFSPQIISPIDGDIVIFPSYLWHEVSSVSFGNRITMPFDVFYDLD